MRQERKTAILVTRVAQIPHARFCYQHSSVVPEQFGYSSPHPVANAMRLSAMPIRIVDLRDVHTSFAQAHLSMAQHYLDWAAHVVGCQSAFILSSGRVASTVTM